MQSMWMQNTIDEMNYIKKLGHFAAGKSSVGLAFNFASLADIFNFNKMDWILTQKNEIWCCWDILNHYLLKMWKHYAEKCLNCSLWLEVCYCICFFQCTLTLILLLSVNPLQINVLCICALSSHSTSTGSGSCSCQLNYHSLHLEPSASAVY